jgi:hypothetical protein
MNLLEHYIDKIISEDFIINPNNSKEYYKVKMIIDCYGSKSETTQMFSVDDWKVIKQKGYYMS